MQDLSSLLTQASLPTPICFPAAANDAAGPSPVTPTVAQTSAAGPSTVASTAAPLTDSVTASNIQQQLALLAEMQLENARLRAFVSTYMATSDKVGFVEHGL